MSNFYDLETDLAVDEVQPEEKEFDDISEFAAFDPQSADSRWGKLDFVELMESAVKRNPRVHYMPIIKQDTLLVMPKDHPCAGKADPVLADFKDDPFILLTDAESLYSDRMVRSTCLSAGFDPEILYAPNLDTQIFWVELNKGLAIANSNHLMANSRAVATCKLKEFPPEDFVLVWNEGNGNPLARVFLEECGRLNIN